MRAKTGRHSRHWRRRWTATFGLLRCELCVELLLQRLEPPCHCNLRLAALVAFGWFFRGRGGATAGRIADPLAPWRRLKAQIAVRRREIHQEMPKGPAG